MRLGSEGIRNSTLTLATIGTVGKICWADAETLALLDRFSAVFGKEIAITSPFGCHNYHQLLCISLGLEILKWRELRSREKKKIAAILKSEQRFTVWNPRTESYVRARTESLLADLTT